MLAQNCLALRGTSDKLYDFGNGNFLQIVQLLAQFDPVMEEHLRKGLKKEEVKVHYLGKEVQNELITLLGENITSHIIGENKKAKYYSVILDCTPDISKTEQMTVLVNDTRWESRTEALKPLRYQLGGIYDALLAICNNSEIDNSLRVEASGLLSCVKQFKFLCCIVIWYKILNCINPISKLLQTKDYDLPSAMELLKNCKDFFKDLRSDTAFNEMLCDARELTDEIDIPFNFELTQHVIEFEEEMLILTMRHEMIR
ncbi:DUF4371 domain-containing protein [Trichonephila clavipes]|uniref:DUF4371 domain-containing protein n=1 Tax=Trichonephila clavipes TaxID=2585209 RepID=A0A8X7BJT4_TRICX|nr:DUF4371 domain-containing protein [Trichonephila clavipes]